MAGPDAPTRGGPSLLARLFALAHARALVATPFLAVVPDRRLNGWLDPTRVRRLGRAPGTGTHRQADVLVVVGRLPQKLAPVLQRAHASLAHPGLVVHVDVEGEVAPSYALVDALAEVIPVDVRILGLAPSEPVFARCAELLDELVRVRRGAR